MNESTATVTTAAAMTGEAAGFHQRHALRALSRMTAGCLRLEMPTQENRLSAQGKHYADMGKGALTHPTGHQTR